MRKRQSTLGPSFRPFVNVFVITVMKSYPILKNAVSMIREERRDCQSLAVWVAWTRRCAASIHVQ